MSSGLFVCPRAIIAPMAQRHFYQLQPSIPVFCSRGAGRAFGVIDYGEDHHLMWIIALDANGQIWTVSNPDVRVRGNDTLGTKAEAVPDKGLGS